MTVKDFDSVYDDAWLEVVEEDFSNDEDRILYASYNDEVLPLEVGERAVNSIYAYEVSSIELAEYGETRYNVHEQDTVFRVYVCSE